MEQCKTLNVYDDFKLYLKEYIPDKLASSITSKLFDMRGGGCDDASEKNMARIWLLLLSTIILGIITNIINTIAYFTNTSNDVHEDYMYDKVSHQSSRLFISSKMPRRFRQKLKEILPKNKFEELEQHAKTQSIVDLKLDYMVESLKIIIGTLIACVPSMGGVLITTRQVDLLTPDAVLGLVDEIGVNIVNHREITRLSVDKLYECWENYISRDVDRPHEFDVFFNPIYDWICNWLYKRLGGKKTKKRRSK